MRTKRLAGCLALIVAIIAPPMGAAARSDVRTGATIGLLQRGTLTIGTNMPYPPMESYTLHHRPFGADISLGTALAASLGLKARFVQVDNFDTIIPKLYQHRFDVIISSMNITPDRQKRVSFIPYMIVGESIVVATGNLKHVQRLDDLAGLNASAQSGTTEQDTLNQENKVLARAHKPLIAVKFYQDDTQALIELLRGQSDAYLTDYPVAAFHTAQSAGSLSIAGRQLYVSPYGIAIRKSDGALLKALRGALRQLHRNGIYGRIIAQFSLGEAALR